VRASVAIADAIATRSRYDLDPCGCGEVPSFGATL
jgi:hypothetical protein